MDAKVKLFSQIKEIFFIVIVSFALALVFRSTVFARVNVVGHSMDTTLHDKDSLFIEKLSFLASNVKRGEIVVLNTKDTNGEYYIKRVIGLEGDTIEVNNGKLYLNDVEQKENYLQSGIETYGDKFLEDGVKYTVPKGSVFVMGDNRTNSCDSRYFGPVKIKDLKGHAVIRIYPFNSMKIFS